MLCGAWEPRKGISSSNASQSGEWPFGTADYNGHELSRPLPKGRAKFGKLAVEGVRGPEWTVLAVSEKNVKARLPAKPATPLLDISARDMKAGVSAQSGQNSIIPSSRTPHLWSARTVGYYYSARKGMSHAYRQQRGCISG